MTWRTWPVAFALLVLAVLLASPAAAQWRNDPLQSGSSGCTLSPGKTCWYVYTSTTAPPKLAANKCDLVHVIFTSNVLDSSTTASQGQIYRCPYSLTGVTHCELVYTSAGATLDGDSSANTDAVYGLVATWIAWVPTANPSSHSSMVEVQCR